MSFLSGTEEERETARSTAARTLGRAVGADNEIALGTRSLLGIFFGLVLICGIFFGLGYSVGRASGSRGAVAGQEMATAVAPDSHLNKPSAEQSLTPAPMDADQDSGAEPVPQPVSAEQATPGNAGQPPASTTAPPARPAPVPTTPKPAAGAVAVPATPAPVAQPVTAPGTTAFMVQVAAVRVPQDAGILVDALRRHGYTAVIRREPQDQLLHIQLGPFATRAEAMAMRSRLLADGYNAVVK